MLIPRVDELRFCSKPHPRASRPSWLTKGTRMMDPLLGMTALALVPLLLTLRGQRFHNHLVCQVAEEFIGAGFDVELERPLQLGDGRCDFVDLLATRGDEVLVCEVETTPRRIVVNAQKAVGLGLPLWIVVPTRRLRSAAQRKTAHLITRSDPICILLPSEVSQALRHCVPMIPAANAVREHRNTTPGPQ